MHMPAKSSCFHVTLTRSRRRGSQPRPFPRRTHRKWSSASNRVLSAALEASPISRSTSIDPKPFVDPDQRLITHAFTAHLVNAFALPDDLLIDSPEGKPRQRCGPCVSRRLPARNRQVDAARCATCPRHRRAPSPSRALLPGFRDRDSPVAGHDRATARVTLRVMKVSLRVGPS